jgi:hypothetical protein
MTEISPWVDSTAVRSVFSTLLDWAQDAVRTGNPEDAHTIISTAFTVIMDTRNVLLSTATTREKFAADAANHVLDVGTALVRILGTRTVNPIHLQDLVTVYARAVLGKEHGWEWFADTTRPVLERARQTKHALTQVSAAALMSMDTTSISLTRSGMDHLAAILRYLNDQSRLHDDLLHHPTYVALNDFTARGVIAPSGAFFIKTMLMRSNIRSHVEHALMVATSLDEVWKQCAFMATTVHVFTEHPGHTLDTIELLSLLNNASGKHLPASLLAAAVSEPISDYEVDSTYEHILVCYQALVSMTVSPMMEGSR